MRGRTGDNQIPFLTLQSRRRILLSPIIRVRHRHSLAKPLLFHQPPPVDVHSSARVNSLMGDERLGVFIGVERVAVEEEHGPDRGVGRHIKDRASAESWVDHLAGVGRN